MLTFRDISLADLNADSTLLRILYKIFAATLNKDLSFPAFRQYYFSAHPNEMDISLILLEGEIIGFCSAAFYPTRIRGKKVIVSRAAIGILPQYRGGSLPVEKLFAKFIRSKLFHPLSSIYLTGFIANPFVYSMICKYVHQVYPKKNTEIPPYIAKLKDDILRSMNLSAKEVSPFVLKIHFPVCLSEIEQNKIRHSDNAHVKFYLGKNPHFDAQHGMLVLAPVNWFNILFSVAQLSKRKIVKLVQGVSHHKTSKELKWKNA